MSKVKTTSQASVTCMVYFSNLRVDVKQINVDTL
jgi:hypothetical protein